MQAAGTDIFSPTATFDLLESVATGASELAQFAEAMIARHGLNLQAEIDNFRLYAKKPVSSSQGSNVPIVAVHFLEVSSSAINKDSVPYANLFDRAWREIDIQATFEATPNVGGPMQMPRRQIGPYLYHIPSFIRLAGAHPAEVHVRIGSTEFLASGSSCDSADVLMKWPMYESNRTLESHRRTGWIYLTYHLLPEAQLSILSSVTQDSTADIRYARELGIVAGQNLAKVMASG